MEVLSMNVLYGLKKGFTAVGIFFLLSLVISSAAFAEQRQVEGIGTYLMENTGIENDEMAKERAKYEAMRDACRQAAVFLERSADMPHGQLTDGELRDYAFKVLRVQGLPYFTQSVDMNGMLFRCQLHVQVDTWDFKNVSSASLQEARRFADNQERLIREMDDLKYSYKYAFSEAEKNDLRYRMKQVFERFTGKKSQPIIPNITVSDNSKTLAKLAYDDGNGRYAYKDYGAALMYYQKALGYDPNLFEAYTNMGIIYKAVLLDYDKARECYEKALAISPADDTTIYDMGLLYRDGYKNYDKAMEYYLKALRVNPEYKRIPIAIAEIYVDTGKIDEAIAILQKTDSEASSTHRAWKTWGRIYYYKGEYDKAMEALDKSIKLKDTYAETYLYRSLTYEKLGNKAEAIKDIEKAKELNPMDDLIKQHYQRLTEPPTQTHNQKTAS